MPEGKEKEKYGEDYSYVTDAINYILIAAECPQKFHNYIYCLIGIADGRPEFEASDSEVASRARGNIAKGYRNATKGWARDKRRDFVKWQDENKITFVDITPGKKTADEYTKSTYKLYLPKYAEQVKDEAQKNEVEFKTDRATAIQQAANGLVAELRAKAGHTTKKKNRTWISPYDEVLRQLRAARTNLKFAVSVLKQNEFQLLRGDEDLIKAIELYIAEINKIGYVDDILNAMIFTPPLDEDE